MVNYIKCDLNFSLKFVLKGSSSVALYIAKGG